MRSAIPFIDPLNIGESIIVVLRRHNNLPIGYLARLIGQPEPVIERYLNTLQQENVVERDGDSVKLIVSE